MTTKTKKSAFMKGFWEGLGQGALYGSVLAITLVVIYALIEL